MNKKYLVSGILILVFLTIAILTFDDSKIDYANFTGAEKSAKTVQIIGSWVKDKPYKYNSDNNEFEFFMTDDQAKEYKVIYRGSKPNNFDIAPKVVVKGKMENGTFQASEILTKCPSKYEGKAEEVKS